MAESWRSSAIFWWPDQPVHDPVGDVARQSVSRRMVLTVADIIVPGHGPAVAPDQSTPR
jgi:hypothetical protein